MWDAKRASSIIYEVAAFPCLPGASKDERLELGVDDPKHLRGKWECLLRCGFVLQNAPSVKWLLCDGHGSHLWLHCLLLGKHRSSGGLDGLCALFQGSDAPRVAHGVLSIAVAKCAD